MRGSPHPRPLSRREEGEKECGGAGCGGEMVETNLKGQEFVQTLELYLREMGEDPVFRAGAPVLPRGLG